MKRLLILISFGALVGATALGVASTAPGGSSSEGDWGDFYDSESLISASEFVVIARLRSEATETVSFPSASDPARSFVRTDLIREFDVVEVLKGQYAEKSVSVRLTVGQNLAGGTRPDRKNADLPVVSLEQQRTYVLFLTQYPVGDGRTAWGPPGEPGVAELKGDRVVFRGTPRYRASITDRGMPLASSDSEAPFGETITSLRAKSKP